MIQIFFGVLTPVFYRFLIPINGISRTFFGPFTLFIQQRKIFLRITISLFRGRFVQIKRLYFINVNSNTMIITIPNFVLSVYKSFISRFFVEIKRPNFIFIYTLSQFVM